ncbi:TAXI family TRAP transporter solute-binding subunit [Gordonia sp. VNQ95]|uniref:TAXI family TRAP transporter solute-binding subunit n=1 Tax=Gordonia sp. VNQ95 TaxID=3156619 RepID=UPI0032B4A62A
MRRRDVLRAALILPFVATACGPGAPRDYRIATGEPGGFQSEFAKLLSSAMADGPVTLTPINTAGSLRNIDLLKVGEVNFGLSLGDVAAATGDPLRAVGRVYENYVQLAVPADSTVAGFADLRGRRVSLGARGSGTEWTGLRVLQAAGMSPADIEITPVSLTDVLSSLADGTVAAAMWAGGVPTPSAVPRPGYGPPEGIRLIPLTRELAVLRERFGPLYEPVSIPARIYGTATETATIGVPSVLLTTVSTPDEAVSAVVDTLIDRADALIPPGTVGVQFLDTQTLIQTYGLPLHPGAVAAYRRHHR